MAYTLEATTVVHMLYPAPHKPDISLRSATHIDRTTLYPYMHLNPSGGMYTVPPPNIKPRNELHLQPLAIMIQPSYVRGGGGFFEFRNFVLLVV